MDNPLFNGISTHVLIMSVIEVLKWKIKLQITEIFSGMGKELDRCYVGGEIYQATYILYQVKGVHPGVVFTLNEIAVHYPTEVGVYNGNEGSMHEYEFDDFIQI